MFIIFDKTNLKGNTANVIARRVSEKLRDCYANKLFKKSIEEKISQGVILEEEKSKPIKKKKNKKKKNKSSKTSAVSSMLASI